MSVAHNDIRRRILLKLQGSDSVSQRALSRDLGIALGLTNRLLRRMVKSGWVQIDRHASNRVRYVITPEGIEQEATMLRDYFQEAVGRYRETRERIRESLSSISARWPVDGSGGTDGKRVVFYGTGEVAEIAFVTLQDTDLRLVGVVDTCGDRTFFGLPVQGLDRLTPTDLGGRAFGRLIVTSFDQGRGVPPALALRGFPTERISWL